MTQMWTISISWTVVALLLVASRSPVHGKFTLLWTNKSEEFIRVFEYVSSEWNLGLDYTKRIVNTSDHISFQRQLCQMAKSNERPIVGEIDYETRLLLDSYTKYFDIPFITWSSPFDVPEISLANNKPCKIFSVQPDLTVPLINFLIKWEWTRFIYVYRSEYSFIRMNKVLQKLYGDVETPETFIDILPVHLPADEKGMFHNLRLLDKRISHLSERKLVIDIDGRQELEDLLRCLKLLGMMRHEYHYLMVNFRIMQLPLSSFKSSRVNITGFHILNYLDQSTRSFITKWTRVLGDEELSTVSFILDVFRVIQSLFTNRRFRYPHQAQLDFDCNSFKFISKESGSQQSEDFVSYLKTINTAGQTGSISFDNRTCTRTNVTILLTKFNGQGGGEMIASTSPDSTWKMLGGSDRSRDGQPQVPRNRSEVLKVVTILQNPFVMYAPDVVGKPTSGKKNFQGYCIDLAKAIFNMINRSYEIHLVKDGAFGAFFSENNTWNGIVGELVRGDADIAIAPLTVISSRAKFISFTEPFMTFGLSLIMKKPVETKPGFFSFMKPLSDYVWISTGSACLLIATGLRIIAHISPYEWKRENPFNMGNSIWFSFAAVVRQGAEIFPKSPGGRIIASTWWMFSLVHIAYYTANLAAFLSVANLISPISSIRDLVDKKDFGIKVGTLQSGSTKEFFTKSTLDPYDKVYQIMQKDPAVYTATIGSGVERVRKEPGKYVFILESKMNEYINNRQPCDTMMVGSPFGSNAYAVATRSTTEKDLLIIKEEITDAILQLREKQDLQDFYTEWWIKKGECSVEAGGSMTKPLALANLSGVFYILFFGILLSILLGVIMFMYSFRKLKRRHQVNRNLLIESEN